MLCPSCHNEVSAGAVFCSNCGGAIPTNASVGGTATAAAPARVQPQGGLSETAAAAIAYITIIPAIIFLVMEPYNRMRLVRFHAFQSIGLTITWIALHIVGMIIPVVGWLLLPIIALAMLAIWVVCILKASKGEYFKLPIIGNLAEKQADS